MVLDENDRTTPDALARASTLGVVLLALCPGKLDADALEETVREKLPGELIGQACIRRRLVTIADVDLAVDFHTRMRRASSFEEALAVFREAEALGLARQRDVEQEFDSFFPPTNAGAA